jgi:polar amino acid transport system ATP-binding protein
VISIVGRSGSGKSTLLRCLNLLERPSSGELEIEGRRVFLNGAALPRKELIILRRRLGMVFQGLNLFPHLTAIENVALPLIRGGKFRDREAIDQSLKFLGMVGLADRALDLPETLSGGQQQRVAIARALALRPVALLFDEPTSALDPESTAEVLDVMRMLTHEGMTMVLVTHELGFAREASDRLCFMDDGRIIESGTPYEVVFRPREARTRAFMAQYVKREQVRED